MRGAALALTALALAGCVPRSVPPAPAPPPPPAPAPVRAPPPAPAPAPPPANWQDAPLTPGDWSYRAENGQPTARYATLTIRCAAGAIVQLGLAGSQATFVRTSFGERRLAAGSVPAADPLLDQMAFSRGRVLVQGESGASVIAPSWPELARVVEDCRR